MIGYLEGKILRIQNERCWVVTNGVGYIVSVGARLATNLESGQEISLWIESIVYDGQQHLFGFRSVHEQTWFQWLIAVSGVGGRLAMSVLSSLSLQSLAESITKSDVSALRAIDGVGPKLANRLITELKDKAQTWLHHLEPMILDGSGSVISSQDCAIEKDTILALIALGYHRSDAQAAILSIRNQKAIIESVGQMITQCLPLMSSV